MIGSNTRGRLAVLFFSSSILLAHLCEAQLVLEDFEAFDVSLGSCGLDGTCNIVIDGTTVLDSNTVVAGQGPGLVQPGVRFALGTPPNGDILILGQGSFGVPSQSLLFFLFPVGNIDFVEPVDSFSFELYTLDTGEPTNVGITIFAADDTAVIEFISLENLVSGTVVSRFEQNGIGKVSIGQSISGAAIDNLLFTPIASEPEPTLTLDPLETEIWANGREEARIVATLVDENDQPLAGRHLAVDVVPGNGVTVEPVEGVTDFEGEANFLVRSSHLGKVIVRVIDTASGTTGRTKLNFVKRRAVVFVQGINTTYDFRRPEVVFPVIRASLLADPFGERLVRLVRDAPEQASDCTDSVDSDGDGVPNDGCPLILIYSYTGGVVARNGIWLGRNYRERDTAASLVHDSIPRLADLLKRFSQANPNTAFVVIGHSQGGFIALQLLGHVHEQVDLETLITLDGALGGTPPLETVIAAITRPDGWGPPASDELGGYWLTTEEHFRQGTTAGTDSTTGISNFELVAAARERGTRVATFGSFTDCVFDPNRCRILGERNWSTQVVENADLVQIGSLGENCFGIRCISRSHNVVLRDPDVIALILDFIGSTVVAHKTAPTVRVRFPTTHNNKVSGPSTLRQENNGLLRPTAIPRRRARPRDP